MGIIDRENAINTGDGTYEFDLGTVVINGEVFTNFQAFTTVNTKTYVKEPERSNSGAIENINEHDTFIVPQLTINFKYLSITDYQRLCLAITSNEFIVKYWDKQLGIIVSHKMYCKPEEMTKIYNVCKYLIGVLDYEISFVGTLNSLTIYTFSYNSNGGSARTINEWSVSTTYSKDTVVKSTSDTAVTYYKYINNNSSSGNALTNTDYWATISSNVIDTQTIAWGNSTVISNGDDLINFYTAPSGKTFDGWNTRADGTGWRYIANQSASIFENITLYAQWVS